MPNSKEELGVEFPDNGITHMDFDCHGCGHINSIHMDDLSDALSQAQATAHFVTLQARMAKPMFTAEEIPTIAGFAKSYIKAKRNLKTKWTKQEK